MPCGCPCGCSNGSLATHHVAVIQHLPPPQSLAVVDIDDPIIRTLLAHREQPSVWRYCQGGDGLANDGRLVAPWDQLLLPAVRVIDCHVVPHGVVANTLVDEAHVVAALSGQTEEVDVGEGCRAAAGGSHGGWGGCMLIDMILVRRLFLCVAVGVIMWFYSCVLINFLE